MSVVRWLWMGVCTFAVSTCDWRRPLRVHEIQRGETLIGLARQYQISGGWETVAAYNRRDGAPFHLRTGEILLLPDQLSTQNLPMFAPPISAPPEAWPRPCAVVQWNEAISTEEKVCWTKNQESVCQDWSSGELVFVFESGGREKVRWNGDTYLEVGRFEVVEADLDGDGAKEVMVAALVGVSNGMAAASWQLAILDGVTRAPRVVKLDEYGEGSFVQAAKGCDLLRTEWRWLFDQKRGSGLYFTGRRFRYGRGQLKGEGGILIRRWWDDSLMEDRGSEVEGTLWKSHPAAMLSGMQVQMWREEMERSW